MKANNNKSVYVVSDSLYGSIFGVFSSNRSFNKELKNWANGILNFAKSEEVKVTVIRERNNFGERVISIDHNVPSYSLIVQKIDIDNSLNSTLENISTVWISNSTYDPGTYHIHATQEEGMSHLESINCLQGDGNLAEGMHLQEYEIK